MPSTTITPPRPRATATTMDPPSRHPTKQLAEHIEQGRALLDQGRLIGDISDYHCWRTARNPWIELTTEALRHLYGSEEADNFKSAASALGDRGPWQTEHKRDSKCIEVAIDVLISLQGRPELDHELSVGWALAPESTRGPISRVMRGSPPLARLRKSPRTLRRSPRSLRRSPRSLRQSPRTLRRSPRSLRRRLLLDRAQARSGRRRRRKLLGLRRKVLGLSAQGPRAPAQASSGSGARSSGSCASEPREGSRASRANIGPRVDSGASAQPTESSWSSSGRPWSEIKTSMATSMHFESRLCSVCHGPLSPKADAALLKLSASSDP